MAYDSDGFAGGLTAGLKLGSTIRNNWLESQAMSKVQEARDAQDAADTAQPTAPASTGGDQSTQGAAPDQVSYDDQPADLSTVPHPRAVDAPQTSATNSSGKTPARARTTMPVDRDRASQVPDESTTPAQVATSSTGALGTQLPNTTPSATAAEAPRPSATAMINPAAPAATVTPARPAAPQTASALPPPQGPTPSATAAEAPQPSATAMANPAAPMGAPPQQAVGALPLPAQGPTTSATAAEAPRPSASQMANPAGPTAPAIQTSSAPPPAATGQTSLGQKILSAINPISPARAEPAPPAAAPAAAPVPTTGVAPAPAQATGPIPLEQMPQPAGAPPISSAAPSAPGDHTAPIEKGMPAPARIELPVSNQPVVPGQATPTVQSEPTPNTGHAEARHFHVNPQAYDWLEKNRPEDAKLVQQIANEEHVSPERLAAHWYAESRLRRASPDSNQGARGVLQVIPGTQREVDPNGELDPSRYADSLRMGARYIHKLDSQFGQDTFSSVVAYHAGPQGADDIANGNGAAHPKSMAYATQPAFFGGESIKPSDLTVSAKLDPDQMQQAAAQNGPNGFLHYIASAEPRNMALGAKWRAAEDSMLRLAIHRGSSMQEISGIQDWVLHQSQQGANQALMAGYRSMVLGDNYTASQQLAKAHAFLPDGTLGRFGVDQKNQIWAQRLDESNPSHALGPPQQVTLSGVQAMLAQTRDPNTYVKMVQEQQKTAATLKGEAARERYYDSNSMSRADKAEQQRQQFQERMDLRRQQEADRQQRDAESARTSALKFGEMEERNAAAAGVRRSAADTEVDKYYGSGNADPSGQAGLTPEQQGPASMVHKALRAPGSMITAPEANRLAVGIVKGQYVMRPVDAQRYGVFRQDEKGNVSPTAEAVIRRDEGDMLASRLQSRQAPTTNPSALGAARNAGLANSSRMPSRAETGAPLTPIPATTPAPTPTPSMALN